MTKLQDLTSIIVKTHVDGPARYRYFLSFNGVANRKVTTAGKVHSGVSMTGKTNFSKVYSVTRETMRKEKVAGLIEVNKATVVEVLEYVKAHQNHGKMESFPRDSRRVLRVW